jgi:NAD(P)-dependent dehydrogenase (short-subunit alcohol dehydrogenase family)
MKEIGLYGLLYCGGNRFGDGRELAFRERLIGITTFIRVSHGSLINGFKSPKIEEIVNSLKDKIAIVTGAGGGLGAASAIVLAERGAKVLVAGRRLSNVEVTVSEIQHKGGWAKPIIFDLAEEDQIHSAVDQVAREFGKIDILHNCAADCSPELFFRDRDIETMDVPTWDRNFLINVRGTMLCCKYVLPHMPHHAGASIINTSSNTGLQGNLILNAYSCTKAAIFQLTRNIATTHGKRGIRCNTVTPGMVLTKPNLENTPKEMRDIVESETLLPKLGEPNDIAYVVAFLASDEAKYITGQNIVVDGGTWVHAPGFAQMRGSMAH